MAAAKSWTYKRPSLDQRSLQLQEPPNRSATAATGSQNPQHPGRKSPQLSLSGDRAKQQQADCVYITGDCFTPKQFSVKTPRLPTETAGQGRHHPSPRAPGKPIPKPCKMPPPKAWGHSTFFRMPTYRPLGPRPSESAFAGLATTLSQNQVYLRRKVKPGVPHLALICGGTFPFPLGNSVLALDNTCTPSGHYPGLCNPCKELKASRE